MDQVEPHNQIEKQPKMLQPSQRQLQKQEINITLPYESDDEPLFNISSDYSTPLISPETSPPKVSTDYLTVTRPVSKVFDFCKHAILKSTRFVTGSLTWISFILLIILVVVFLILWIPLVESGIKVCFLLNEMTLVECGKNVSIRP